jgi:hypothetical protein
MIPNNLSDKDKKAFALIRNKIIHYGKSPTLDEINEALREIKRKS